MLLCLSSMEPRLGSRGKPMSKHHNTIDLYCSSMEPRLGSRGKWLALRQRYSRRIPLQWSRDLEVAESRYSRSYGMLMCLFNGAATWKSRKDDYTAFQWRTDSNSSMEPRLGSRGKPLNEGMDRSGKPLFNGAATWKSRKVVHLRTLQFESSAFFNGAATWKSRKDSAVVVWDKGPARLQWSRDLEVAESVRHRYKT